MADINSSTVNNEQLTHQPSITSNLLVTLPAPEDPPGEMPGFPPDVGGETKEDPDEIWLALGLKSGLRDAADLEEEEAEEGEA